MNVIGLYAVTRRTPSNGVESNGTLSKPVKTVNAEERAIHAQQNEPSSPGVDISLQRAPSPEATSVPVDQIMVAVESVRGYVVSHLSRVGRAGDVDDVMQDVRMAVWDGVTRGNYRKLPGIPFGAWVQGVCSNVCAAHIRRELSHATSPLLMDPVTGEGTAFINGWARMAFYGDSGTERLIDQEWARMVLALVRENVSTANWDLAVDSLAGPRRYGPPSPKDRRRWHAASVVRQTAKTITVALEAASETNREKDVPRVAANCLPTPVLRRIAEDVVTPGVSGPERTRAIARLAEEFGVSERYIAVQIGLVRQLYRAAWRVLWGQLKPAD